MNETSFKIGSEVFHGNTRYRVIQVLDLEHVSLRNSFTGAVKKFHISEISSSPGDESNPVDIIPATEFLTIPDDTWIEVNNKALRFNQIMQEEDEIERRKKIIDFAKEYDISESTAYRQLQKYKESNGNPLSLMRKKRSESGRFEPEIEELIQKSINTYLTPIKPTVSAVHRDLEVDIYALNKHREVDGLPLFDCPHINTLRHRISLLSGAEISTKREGKKGREAHRPIRGKFPELQKPLQVVQIDHSPLDGIIVSEESRMDIGRPTITLAIDVYSRMVIGFCISLEKPNTLLTGLCLSHAILDKKKWLLDHDIEGEWPCYGLMDTIHTDNGKEFHGNTLKRACQIYNINMTKRPSGTPRYGGHVERAFRTYNQMRFHNLPGTTKSNIQDKGEYNSQENAIFTLFEIESLFTDFLVNDYHLSIHSELDGLSPIQKYKKGIIGDKNTIGRGLPPKIDNSLKLMIDFLPYKERTVQKYGIQIEGIYYFHDILRKWIKQPDKTRKGSRKFIVRYDPRDLSVVFFYDPDMEAYTAVPYRDTSHPAISLWELREIKRILKEESSIDEVTEQTIFECRARMRRRIEHAKKETKHVRRIKEKESIREKESIPSLIAHQKPEKRHSSVISPALDELDDDEFDNIQPYESIDQ